MKKLLIETYGCQMNVADSEVIASILKMAGYDPCEDLDEADAILLNTCSVRQNAENKIINRLEVLHNYRLKRKNKPLIIGVVGCMAERVREELIEQHHVDLVAGPDSYLNMPELIAAAEMGEKAINIDLSTTHPNPNSCQPCVGIREHHERMQQLLPLLHRTLHQRKGKKQGC